jgi:hypothetical protein
VIHGTKSGGGASNKDTVFVPEDSGRRHFHESAIEILRVIGGANFLRHLDKACGALRR